MRILVLALVVLMVVVVCVCVTKRHKEQIERKNDCVAGRDRDSE